MIKLDAPRSNNSSLTQVAHESGTNNSTVMNRLSAIAQRAMGFGNYVSRNFLKTSKTVALAVAAVFAFSAAQAQVYFNGFDGSVTIAPNLTASAVPSGITTTIFACPGGGGALVYDAGAANFSPDFTFSVAPGFRLKIDSITVDFKRASARVANHVATTQLTNYTIMVDGSPFGSPIANQTFGNSCTRVNVGGSYTSNAGATVTVELDGAVPTGTSPNLNQDLLLDNFYIHGSIICEAVSVLPSSLSGTSTCPAGGGTVSVAFGITGYNYVLFKDGIATGASALGSTPATINFPVTTGGVYTVEVINTADNNCRGFLAGSALIQKQPTLYTVSGGGNVCLTPPGSTTVTLSGSEVGVSYQLWRGATAVGTPVIGSGNALTFNVSGAGAAGSYTVTAVASATYCARTMAGSATVTQSQPTAFFANATTSAPANVQLCAVSSNNPVTNNDATFIVKGTPGATVNFTVSGGLSYTGTVTLLADSTGSITVNDMSANTTIVLTQATTGDGCTQNLVAGNLVTATVTVRDQLAFAWSTANQTICSNAPATPTSFTRFGYTLNGSAYARTVYYRIVPAVGATVSSSMSVPVGVATVTASSNSAQQIPTAAELSALATSTTGSSITHSVIIDSVLYATAPPCTIRRPADITTTAATRTLTVNPRPAFQFAMNGTNLRAGSRDTICVPSNQATFTVVGTSGHTYTVTRNGAPFGSAGTINNNGSGTVTSINAPGGTYVVTVTGPNCDSSATFIVDEQQRPTFTYKVKNQTVNNGDTVAVCVGEIFRDTLRTTVSSGAASITYTIGGVSVLANAATTTSSSPVLFTSSQTGAATTTTLYQTVTVRVQNNPTPNFGVCDSMITFTLRTNPLPVLTDIRYYPDATQSGYTTVSNNLSVSMCEDRNPAIRVYGTPGHTVEIHYNKGTSVGAPANQVQTGVIGTNGYYAWNTANGIFLNDYTSSFDACSSTDRMHYRVEVRNPETLCSSSLLFNSKIKQRASVRVGYATSNTIGGVAYSTIPSTTSATGNGTTIQPNTLVATGMDTLNICYTLGASDIKYYVEWLAAGNQTAFNCGVNTNTILFEIRKGTASGALVFQGSTTNATTAAQTHQMPITAGSSGLYTIVAVNGESCDSVRSFWIKAYESPVHSAIYLPDSTTVGTIVATVPGNTSASTTNPLTYCQNVTNKAISIWGVNNSGSTQTFSLVRTGTTNASATAGAGTFTTVNGTLSATPQVINFNTLGVGTHHFLLTVTANPGACPVYRSFRVNVTEMPKPVLRWRPFVLVQSPQTPPSGQVIAPNATLTFCQEETIEYTITGVPAGGTYWLFRNGTQIATGVSSTVETSVISLVQEPFTAGNYEVRMRNAGNGINCDSSYFFTVNVNDRPDITIDSTRNVTVCRGDNTGAVWYHYTTTVPGTLTTRLYRTSPADTAFANATLVLNSTSTQTSLAVEHPNLYGGLYKLVITNAVGCSDTEVFTIYQPDSTLYLFPNSITHACPAATGSVIFTVGGGAAGYNMQIFDANNQPVGSLYHLNSYTNNYQYLGLAPGTYKMRATDANGCIKDTTFTINACSSANLAPGLVLPSSNFSLASTTSLPFSLNLYNVGQIASTGTIQVTLNIPTGFSITGVSPAAWTSSQVGIFTVLSSSTVSVATGFANPSVISGNIVKTGTPTAGFYVIIANIVPGSGGESISSDNTTVALLNVNP